MRIRRDFPHAVSELEHIEISMPDGCRLAARIWMPEGAAGGEPVPAILEYLPYRKNDRTLARDAARAPFIAGHGYAYVRVDLRGCGESEGLMLDEYLPQELQDGLDVIAWIAAQAWCDGQVGIVGISWGGFNGLQLAALRPPALKAVVTLCSTDDRYADDIHYMGGALLVEQLSWASVMFGINTLPPDPRHVGERWRALWHERLSGSGLWLKNWLAHQHRDEFWKHGSICEDHAAVQVPVYAIGGWADGYCRTVFRLLQHLRCPRKGLVGPWAHKYPHLGEPGPAIDWLNEELRWWDHWMKGRENGIMQEAPLRLFVQDHAEPRGHHERREGYWITEPSWPSPDIERTGFALGVDGTLTRITEAAGESEATDADDGEEPVAPVIVSTHPAVGLAAGKWCSYAQPGDQPGDQREDDAASVTFETPPLDVALVIVGDPSLELVLSSDQPVAILAARLVDVAPDGAATRVSYGLLNLTHRVGHEAPEPLVPGRRYCVEVPMKPVAQTFRAGHRIRLALSTTYFPMAWPAPVPATLTLDAAKCALELPVREADRPEAVDFDPPVAAPPARIDAVTEGGFDWRIRRHEGGGVTVTIDDDDGARRIVDNDLLMSSKGVETYDLDATGEPSARIVWTHRTAREDWQVSSVTETQFSSTTTTFRIKARLRAWEGDELVHEREWDETIERDLV